MKKSSSFVAKSLLHFCWFMCKVWNYPVSDHYKFSYRQYKKKAWRWPNLWSWAESPWIDSCLSPLCGQVLLLKGTLKPSELYWIWSPLGVARDKKYRLSWQGDFLMLGSRYLIYYVLICLLLRNSGDHTLVLVTWRPILMLMINRPGFRTHTTEYMSISSWNIKKQS